MIRAVPCHTDALMGPALAADAAMRVGGASAVLEVVSPRCRQGGLKRSRPVVVGLGESPNLVGGQAKVTEHGPERLAAVDRVEELLSHLDRESPLRLPPEAGPRSVVLGLAASGAVTSLIPPCHGAVGHLRATPASAGIGLIADLL